MPIAARCPHCLAELRARDDLAGRPVKCTKCGGLLSLPGEPATTTPREPARKPVAKGGKLPLIWLLVGGAVAVFGCVLCGGGAAVFYFVLGTSEVVTTTAPTTPVAEATPVGNPAPPPPVPTPAPARPKLGTPTATVTSVEISGEYQKNAATAAKKYTGKVIRVRGAVVGRSGDDTLVLEGEFDAKAKGRRMVTCKVHPADHVALADVRPRATVTLIGKCTGLTKGTNAIALTDCLFEE